MMLGKTEWILEYNEHENYLKTGLCVRYKLFVAEGESPFVIYGTLELTARVLKHTGLKETIMGIQRTAESKFLWH